MAWQAVPPSTPLTHTGNAEEGDGSSGGGPVRRRRSSFRSKHGESGGTATATGSNPPQTSPPLPPTHRFHPPLPHKNNKRKKERRGTGEKMAAQATVPLQLQGTGSHGERRDPRAKRWRAQSFRSSSPCISDGREGGGPPQWRA